LVEFWNRAKRHIFRPSISREIFGEIRREKRQSQFLPHDFGMELRESRELFDGLEHDVVAPEHHGL
jgi:hypothetical protein